MISISLNWLIIPHIVNVQVHTNWKLSRWLVFSIQWFTCWSFLVHRLNWIMSVVSWVRWRASPSRQPKTALLWSPSCRMFRYAATEQTHTYFILYTLLYVQEWHCCGLKLNKAFPPLRRGKRDTQTISIWLEILMIKPSPAALYLTFIVIL